MVEFSVYVLKACLEKQWENLMQLNLAQWKEAFSASDRVGKVIEESFEKFKVGNTPVPVYMAWNPRLFLRGDHLISVALGSQESQDRFFHNGSPGKTLSGGLPIFSSGEEVELAVWVLSPKPETVMFLHSFVRRAILTDIDWLVAEGGFDDIYAAGAQDIQAPADLTPDGIPAMYGRRIKVIARAIDSASAFVRPAQSTNPPAVLVHDTETQVDAIVDRATRTETPIPARYGRVEKDTI
jgi:hypothetical protein